jgi:outer membrane protein assembly factor BamB
MKKIILLCLALLPAFLPVARAREAKPILDAAGVRGGLVVVLGCDDPDLLVSLRAAGPYLVHGLDADPAKVARARKALLEKKAYGPVTVSRLPGATLPYTDDLVNLLVLAGDPGAVAKDEMARVLAPGGALADARQTKVGITREPRPEGIDDWPHYLYDASNNAVSKDTVVGPPRGLRWICGPAYARSHEHFGSVSALVADAGRIFYIIDEGPISSVFLPPVWKLVARDAFSGVKLWERPIENWESQLRGFRSGPPEIGRRLVADGNRIYVTLGYGGPVSVLDAATGKDVKTLPGTPGARELLLQGDVLYVLADDMTAEQHDKRRQWINETAPMLTGYQFPKQPIPMYGKPRLVALKKGAGTPVWTKACGAAGEIMPATLAVAGGRVCYQSVSHVVCLDAATGGETWRSERPVAKSRFSWSTPTLVVQDGVVLTIDRVATANADNDPPAQGSKWLMNNAHQTKKQDAELVAFALQDGKELWRAPYFENYDTPLDIFVIDGVVWVGDLRHSRDAGFTEGRDLRTGKVAAKLPHNKELYSIQMGHHRCHRNRATVKWLILGRDGIEMVDPKNGTGSGNWWVRGTCQYGVMPANGLLYAPQHSCACHPQEKLNGFNVLSARSNAGAAGGKNPLEKGPAFDAAADVTKSEAKDDWPTYRRDARRSGYQDLPAPRKVNVAWSASLLPPVTAPVVAGGRAFIAETDRHTLHALAASDGKPDWTFTADGRIDSPPTVYGDLCLFGTRNGYVYCLRASDGALAWRYRAAPAERRLFAWGQLESVWPLHGTVLVDDTLSGGAPVVYAAAGRSSHVDGGIRLVALDLKTGKRLHQADVTMTAKEEGAGVIRQRSLPDVLSVQKGTVWMRDLGLPKDLSAPAQKVPHLYAPGGFLDDTWWHRTYWEYGTTMASAYGGWPRVGNVVPAGRLLAFDGGEHIYGYGRMSYRAGGGHVKPDAAKEYKLFAEVLEPKPKAQPKAPAGRKKRKGPTGRRENIWTAELPFVARALVLTPDALLVGGGRSLTERADAHGPGTLWIAARGDGAKRFTCALPAPPVLDGMAFAAAGLFVSTVDGRVVCLRGD